MRVAQSLKPDVIIMDVMMPLKNGIDAVSDREITEMLPDTRMHYLVLMLTASAEEDAVMEAGVDAAGATGYLQKYSGKETLGCCAPSATWRRESSAYAPTR